MHLFARLWHRCAPRPRAALPAFGPAVLIANHPSHADPAFLLASSNRLLHFLQAREYHNVRFMSRFFDCVGCVPVARHGREVRGIRRALRLLARGEVVALFPEGDVRRAGRGRLAPGKPGAALLALRSGAPVFPAWIEGGPESRDLLWAWLRPSHGVRVTFGPAIDLDAYRNQPINPALLQEATEALMRGLAALAPIASDVPVLPIGSAAARQEPRGLRARRDQPAWHRSAGPLRPPTNPGGFPFNSACSVPSALSRGLTGPTGPTIVE